jgi:hypothetical protein
MEWDFHGFSWIFMDFHGFSWIFTDFHGFSPEMGFSPGSSMISPKISDNFRCCASCRGNWRAIWLLEMLKTHICRRRGASFEVVSTRIPGEYHGQCIGCKDKI